MINDNGDLVPYRARINASKAQPQSATAIPRRGSDFQSPSWKFRFIRQAIANLLKYFPPKAMLKTLYFQA